MQYKFQLLLLFLIGTSFSRVIAQQTAIVNLEPDTSTIFHWGAITVPMANMMVPRKEGQRVEVKFPQPTIVSINELIISLRDRIFLYKNQQIVPDFKTLSLAFSPSYETVQKLVKRGVPAREAQTALHKKRYTLELAANDSKTLTEAIVQEIRNIIDHDTRVTIIINDGEMRGNIIIKAIYAPYEPPIIVQHKQPEFFKFQLLEPLEGETILRVDTNENKRVYNMYKSSKQTTIIHLPNFQTATRTVSEKDEDDLTKILKQASSYPPLSVMHSLEYVSYLPTELKLSMGGLIANPESQNYALATFAEQKGKLVLQHKEEILKIKSFRLSIFDKAEKVQSHSIKLSKKNKWLAYLDNLSYENSIYVDKLIIEKDKQIYYLGQAFLFKIGKVFLKE